jgi:hypothetical protein
MKTHKWTQKFSPTPHPRAFCCTALEHPSVCETKPKALAASEYYRY